MGTACTGNGTVPSQNPGGQGWPVVGREGRDPIEAPALIGDEQAVPGRVGNQRRVPAEVREVEWIRALFGSVSCRIVLPFERRRVGDERRASLGDAEEPGAGIVAAHRQGLAAADRRHVVHSWCERRRRPRVGVDDALPGVGDEQRATRARADPEDRPIVEARIGLCRCRHEHGRDHGHERERTHKLLPALHEILPLFRSAGSVGARPQRDIVNLVRVANKPQSRR